MSKNTCLECNLVKIKQPFGDAKCMMKDGLHRCMKASDGTVYGYLETRDGLVSCSDFVKRKGEIECEDIENPDEVGGGEE